MELCLRQAMWRDVERIAAEVGLIVAGKAVTAKEAADLWINALYAHSDVDKGALLRHLSEADRVRLKCLCFDLITTTIIYALHVKLLIQKAHKHGIIGPS